MPKAPLIETAAIERATRFDATIFLGTGRFRSESFDTLPEARAAAVRFAAEVRNGRKGMVYAIGAGRSVFVPDSYQPNPKGETSMAIQIVPQNPAVLSGQQVAQLTAMITGGGFKRANSRDAAVKRFETVAAERGIVTDRILGAGSFEQAKSVLAHSLKTTPAKATDTPPVAFDDETPLPEIDAAMGIAHKPVRVRAVPISQAKAKAARDGAQPAKDADYPAPAKIGGGKGKAIAEIKGEPKLREQIASAKASREAAKPEKPAGKRAAALEAAQRGEVPAAPDFSANTHKPHRKKLADVVALVEAGDIAALKAFHINPVSSSPKAIAKYRDLAVIALEAQSIAGQDTLANE